MTYDARRSSPITLRVVLFRDSRGPRPIPMTHSELLRLYRRSGHPLGRTTEGFALWVRFHGGSRTN